MAGSHKPWSGGGPHSAALLARVRELCTLQDVHERTAALGEALSVSQIHRMETEGVGSADAWAVLARVLHVEVATIRPARGYVLDEPQLVLPETSS